MILDRATDIFGRRLTSGWNGSLPITPFAGRCPSAKSAPGLTLAPQPGVRRPKKRLF